MKVALIEPRWIYVFHRYGLSREKSGNVGDDWGVDAGVVGLWFHYVSSTNLSFLLSLSFLRDVGSPMDLIYYRGCRVIREVRYWSQAAGRCWAAFGELEGHLSLLVDGRPS